MNKYEMYNRVLSALNEDESTFNAAAKNWVENTAEANFQDEKAIELFAKAKLYCAIWRKGEINSRISKKRMIACVREIAMMNLPNPYDPNEVVPEPVILEPIVSAPVQEEPDVVEGQEVSSSKEEPVSIEEPVTTEEPVHVLGVVPEENKKLFSRRKKR